MLSNFKIHSLKPVNLFLLRSGEKRPAEDPPAITEEPRKKKIEGDVSSEVIAEILQVTSDPKKMHGPDVSFYTLVYK